MRINGDPVAANNGIFYFHTDHLGSTSVMTKHSDGYIVTGSLARYTPFGDWRTEPSADLTDRGYTGHKSNNLESNDLGLIYMNARFFLPGVARFVTADTIVPDPTNPQSLNRYSYALNNSIKFSDPSGHCVEAYAETDSEMLNYCVQSVLTLAQHLDQNYEEDFSEFIQWMMMYSDIDFVTGYSEQMGLTPLENRPKPISEKQWDGCSPLQSGGKKCAPDEGWPQYYPGTEEFIKNLAIETGKKVLLLPVGPIIGKLMPEASFVERFIITFATKKVISTSFEDSDEGDTNDLTLSLVVNENQNHISTQSERQNIFGDYVMNPLYGRWNYVAYNDAYLHIRGDR